jgi:hypothetical protein
MNKLANHHRASLCRAAVHGMRRLRKPHPRGCRRHTPTAHGRHRRQHHSRLHPHGRRAATTARPELHRRGGAARRCHHRRRGRRQHAGRARHPGALAAQPAGRCPRHHARHERRGPAARPRPSPGQRRRHCQRMAQGAAGAGGAALLGRRRRSVARGLGLRSAQALAAARGARFVDAYTASRSDWLCHPTDHHPCEAAHREIGAMVRTAAFAP